MNKNIKTYLLAFGLLFTLYACQDILNTNSSLFALEDEYQVSNETEALNALTGIAGELVSIADRYVLMGELRGDLMMTSEFASSELQDVARFQVSKENEYVDKRDYYRIINNCNFLLQKLDTSLIMQNEKVLLRCHVWTKTLRAWTYFQLGQVYGKATYFTEPILDLNASLTVYPELQLDDLVNTLIDELKPYASLFTNNAFSYIIHLRMLLGDLYLYKNDYRTAASLYYDEITDWQITIPNNANRWANMNMESVSIGHAGTYSGEVITNISGYISMQNTYSRLVNLSYNDKPSIIPAENYVRFMSEALYLHAASDGVLPVQSGGDLRGYVPFKYSNFGDAYNYVDVKGNQECLIYKYYNNSNYFNGSVRDNELLYGLNINTNIPIYRRPHLYLRFAEALNRLGKPTLSFAVLKYGLKDAIVRDTIMVRVNPDELGEEFTHFPLATFFDGNTAMSGRGRGGGVPLDTVNFIIPDLPSKQDSILWVEDRILEEFAAETPFEGNRFFDLLRISSRRPNHPEYMAEKVAAKYKDKEAMKAKLMNREIWFLP